MHNFWVHQQNLVNLCEEASAMIGGNLPGVRGQDASGNSACFRPPTFWRSFMITQFCNNRPFIPRVCPTLEMPRNCTIFVTSRILNFLIRSPRFFAGIADHGPRFGSV